MKYNIYILIHYHSIIRIFEIYIEMLLLKNLIIIIIF